MNEFFLKTLDSQKWLGRVSRDKEFTLCFGILIEGTMHGSKGEGSLGCYIGGLHLVSLQHPILTIFQNLRGILKTNVLYVLWEWHDSGKGINEFLGGFHGDLVNFNILPHPLFLAQLYLFSGLFKSFEGFGMLPVSIAVQLVVDFGFLFHGG